MHTKISILLRAAHKNIHISLSTCKIKYVVQTIRVWIRVADSINVVYLTIQHTLFYFKRINYSNYCYLINCFIHLLRYYCFGMEARLSGTMIIVNFAV